jgi:hypothetical protein
MFSFYSHSGTVRIRARHLKAELKRADLTYEELAAPLKKHGFAETKASIANKLARRAVAIHDP